MPHCVGSDGDLAEELGDPADAFHVVCPSLPGYGFSDKPTATGWGTDHIGAAWAQLMARLGYARYGAIGNDAGSMISPELGRLEPERDLGLHVGELLLHELIGGERPAELLPVEHVLAGAVPAELGGADGAPGDAGARDVGEHQRQEQQRERGP